MDYWKDKKILLTGGEGFLGSFIQKKLSLRGVDKSNIIIPDIKDCDLRIWENCKKSVKGIDIVIHLAASVGGIGFNKKYPGSLFYDNAIMGIQLIEAARQEGVKKFVAIGTICAYPKFTPVPFKEEELWNGYPEETNAPYGVAKKMLLVQLQSYREEYGFNGIYLLPVNLYGPKDNFHLEHSHVIPALIRKMIDARENDEETVTVWGTGEVSREFLYVDDAAEAILLASEKYNGIEPVNLGVGKEIKIKELVDLIVELTGYKGKVIWDSSRPDGQPRRSLDVSRAKKEFSFAAEMDFQEGLKNTIEWYEKNRL